MISDDSLAWNSIEDMDQVKLLKPFTSGSLG